MLMEDSRGWRFLDPRLEYQRLDHDTACHDTPRHSPSRDTAEWDEVPIRLFSPGIVTYRRLVPVLDGDGDRGGFKEGCLGTNPAVVDSQANPD